MKKITLLLLFCSSITFGQVLISEDFEAGLSVPTGWTNNEITALGNIWTFETGGSAKYLGNPNTAFYSEGGFSGNYAIFDSDGYGGGPEEATLESPTFDCTGLTNIKLTFNHLFVSGFGGAGYVEVYNGTSWIEITSYAEPGVTANTFVAGPIILDVTTELMDVTNARVRFRWVGNNSYYWGIDNVVVQQPTIPAPNPVTTPNPTNGSVDVVLALDTDYNNDLVIDENDAAYTFTWENAATGETPAGYVFYFGTSSPPSAFADISNNSYTIYGLQYSTTYYWAAVAYNVTGGAAGTSIWSFTTEANPNLSLDEKELSSIKIYPNPVTDVVNFKTNEIIEEITIINQLGQRVMEFKGNQIFKNSVDLSNLSKGVYILNVKADNKIQALKINKN